MSDKVDTSFLDGKTISKAANRPDGSITLYFSDNTSAKLRVMTSGKICVFKVHTDEEVSRHE